MYKLLLCWRYLRTRWIALASIVSVMLGVATMIVVNSVMEGFTTEMQNRIHGILSDIIFESRFLGGFKDPEWHMEQIRQVAGDDIEGLTPTVMVPAMLSFQYGGEWMNRQVQLIGIDAATQNHVSDFAQFLQHPENRRQVNFDLRESGYDDRDHQGGPDAAERPQMRSAGWVHRRRMAEAAAFNRSLFEKPQAEQAAAAPGDAAADDGAPTENPFDRHRPQPVVEFDPAKEQFTGAILGMALTSYRNERGEDRFVLVPGDDVKLTFPTAGTPPEATSCTFTIVDYYESKMSEYDSSFVFVPIEKLQQLRGMFDRGPAGTVVYANTIQIRLKPGVDLDAVRDKLRAAFSPELYAVSTWRDKQGTLLAAVNMETAILNVLLFLIIAVAGFGILAIFYMIVVEKTRDIGILKSLGASGGGIMSIFLGYGLLLGVVGSGVGLLMGLAFVWNINEIAELLGWITGRPVFDPSIYYFYRIPTIVDPSTIAWIVAGAIAIAVLASILPARRAAGLHPVEALRYE